MASSSAAERRIRARFLDRRVRIQLRNDLRSFSGKLVCVDRDGNSILHEAVEYRLDPESMQDKQGTDRFLPMVMIPGQHIAKLGILRNLKDNTFLSQGASQDSYTTDQSMYL